MKFIKQKLIFSTYFVGMITYNFVNAFHTGQKRLIEYRMKPKYVKPETFEDYFKEYYIELEEYKIVSREINNKSFEHFIDSLIFPFIPFKMIWDVIPYLVITLNSKTNLNKK